MSYLSEAFDFIVPKSYYHTNSQYMVIDDDYQISDLRNNVSCEPPCPTEAQKFPMLPRRGVPPAACDKCTFKENQLPATRLPYHPPSSLKYPKMPAFEPIYSAPSGERCSFIDSCDSICFRKT